MKFASGGFLCFAVLAGCAVGDPAVIAGAAPLEEGGGAAIDASVAVTRDGSGGLTTDEAALAAYDASAPALSEGGAEGSSPPVVDGSSARPAPDPRLPPEPTIAPPCATLSAAKAATNGFLPDENNPDTARIQSAISGCAPGHSVKLQSAGANNAFLSGPLTMAAGVTLWVDASTTLFASRDPREFDISAGSCGTYANNSSAGCKPLIAVGVANAAIAGDGVIDGRGGEPMIGSTTTSWWDLAKAGKAAGSKHSNPTLIDVSGTQSFTLYRIALHNSPAAHVVLTSKGFVVWGVTVLTPSAARNSLGNALTANDAPNTDGIDPSGASDGFLVYSKISTGDVQIAVKAGSRGPAHNLVIAHDRLGTGHGMAIGSETNNGVSNVAIYDLSMDGSLPDGKMSSADRNGIRLISGPSRGGHVTGVTYSDVCVRDLDNPIVIDARASTPSGSLVPLFDNVIVSRFHALHTSVVPSVTLNGYDASHTLGVTLDDVVVDGILASNVKASFAATTLGPGPVNFVPSGMGVTVSDRTSSAGQAGSCAEKWVTF
ncbi:MAG: glycoside hydrolase family 28 protein [Myxococcota bacterium]|nr:glycoside hydrolase family 28 protein [Myxococcota bacterium]